MYVVWRNGKCPIQINHIKVNTDKSHIVFISLQQLRNIMLAYKHSQFLVRMIDLYIWAQSTNKKKTITCVIISTVSIKKQIYLCTQYFQVTLLTERRLKFAGHIISQSEHQLPCTDNERLSPILTLWLLARQKILKFYIGMPL